MIKQANEKFLNRIQFQFTSCLKSPAKDGATVFFKNKGTKNFILVIIYPGMYKFRHILHYQHAPSNTKLNQGLDCFNIKKKEISWGRHLSLSLSKSNRSLFAQPRKTF